MGNRAVVTWVNSDGIVDGDSIGVYLHWDGDFSSVKAFLQYCKIVGFRNPSEDNYGIARFIQVVSNYFGADGLDIGVGRIADLDCNNFDNGMYICNGWDIVERAYVHEDCVDVVNDNSIRYMLQSINADQPIHIQNVFNERYEHIS